MAKSVVNGFEVIDIRQNDGKHRLISIRPLDLVSEQLRDPSSIVEAG